MTTPFKTKDEVIAHLRSGKRLKHEAFNGPFYLKNGSIVYARKPDIVLKSYWYSMSPEKWSPFDAWYDYLPGIVGLIGIAWLLFC